MRKEQNARRPHLFLFKNSFAIFFLFLFSVLTGVVLSCGEYDTLLHDREKNFSQKKLRGIIQESLEAQNICKKGVAHNWKRGKLSRTAEISFFFFFFFFVKDHYIMYVHNTVQEAKGDHHHHHPLRSKK